MSDNQGVQDSPPTASVTQDVTLPADSSPAASGVTATSPVADRNLENVFREMQRRDQDRQKQLDTVLAWIGSQAQASRPTASAAMAEPTDEELWSLAQQGDRAAFEMYQRRIARREVAQVTGQQSRASLVTAQLNTLVQKYPVLRDPSHALTQTVQQAYALLLQAGYTPDASTLLEATKTAIADRPDIVAEIHTGSREHARQTATSRSQSGVTGSTVRSESQPRPTQPIPTEEVKLAARMGVKDPKAAKERFLKRLDAGQTSLGAVGGMPSVAQEMENF